jgi:hypothetical protein
VTDPQNLMFMRFVSFGCPMAGLNCLLTSATDKFYHFWVGRRGGGKVIGTTNSLPVRLSLASPGSPTVAFVDLFRKARASRRSARFFTVLAKRYDLHDPLVMAQVRDASEYENNPHNNENGPPQPLGRRLLVWLGLTDEGGIKFARTKPKYDRHKSYKYLKNSPCHECFRRR